MDAETLVGAMSVLGACLVMGIGSIGSAIGEGLAVSQALASMAQQPDEAGNVTRTMFVGCAVVESTAIYSFVIAMIVLFANPIWNHVIGG
ncbi:MAG: ATP synthase F0 subunit C [Alphaproteobacteria bacterium]